LEFVWDQIKSNSNSVSDSSSHEYRALRPSLPGRFESNYDDDDEEEEDGEQNQTLRLLSPVSDGQGVHEHEDVDYGHEENDENDLHQGYPLPRPGEETEDEFVDAHEDSQIALDDGPPLPSPNALAQHALQIPLSVPKKSGVVSSISAYLHRRPSVSAPKRPAGPASPIDAAWARRIEAALIKLNTEMTALRETLESTQHSSILPLPLPSFHRRPSSPGLQARKKFSVGNVARSLLSSVWRVVVGTLRHVLLDAVTIAAVSLVLHYRGIPVERVEEVVVRWIAKIRALTLLKRLEKVAVEKGKMVRLPALPSAFIGKAAGLTG